MQAHCQSLASQCYIQMYNTNKWIIELEDAINRLLQDEDFVNNFLA